MYNDIYEVVTEVATRQSKIKDATKAIKNKLYPKIASLMDKNVPKYRKAVSTILSNRSEQLYDIAPFQNMFFLTSDADLFYKAIGITQDEIYSILLETYFMPITNFNPRSAKDEFTAMQMCVIRYFMMKKNAKDLELSIAILMLSGKFYPSAFSMSFPTVAPAEYRNIMMYAVNNNMSNKFELKTSGHVFGALRSIGTTWVNTYDEMFNRYTDEDYVYLVQQIQTRLRSFMKNIAEVYYDCYKNKEYLNFDSDNFDEDNYRLADTDTLKIERIVEKTITKINSSKADYAVCKMVSSDLVRIDEVKTIIDSIIADPEKQSEIKELINLMVTMYFANSKTKDVRDISFLTYTIAAKPNTKNPNLIRQKEIVTRWLVESPSNFIRRRSREDTANAYYRAVYSYFAIIIQQSNN